jgi:hypothetical protein
MAKGKNGDRPHFLQLCPQVENVLFRTKWGLSPFFPMNDSERLNLQSRFIPSCVFYPHYLEENRFIKSALYISPNKGAMNVTPTQMIMIPAIFIQNPNFII